MPAATDDRPDLTGQFAAVDLGSNSFHLVVARLKDGEIHLVDRLREMVRLAAGIQPDRTLDRPAQQRALECLRRFRQRLRDLPEGNIRAVGTNTFRAARDSAFLAEAEEALGRPIEVIAGVEEARLIYLGVARHLASEDERHLVVDIGGGSTELIIGEDARPLHLESLLMGCVSVSQRHFADGEITRKRLRRAEIEASVELEAVASHYHQLGWDRALGASGTVRAIERILETSGWTTEGIDQAGLERLHDALLKAGHVDNLRLPGLSSERTPVFPGGVAILRAVFGSLHIERMHSADGALREGLLYDLVGRLRREDVRDSTVAAVANRYHVDAAQASRVLSTARMLLRKVTDGWELHGRAMRQQLSWAAQLHEIGLDIAHSQYHKHGAYVIEHADLLGFSRREQQLLALLVRAHRRKFPRELFRDLPAPWDRSLRLLALLLRLAVVLHRGRTATVLPAFEIVPGSDTLSLRFPEEWLHDHPLTSADLQHEVAHWKRADVELDFQ